jgi:hypothetical protein
MRNIQVTRLALCQAGGNFPDRVCRTESGQVSQSRVLRKVRGNTRCSLANLFLTLLVSFLETGISPCPRGRQEYPQMKVCTYQ